MAELTIDQLSGSDATNDEPFGQNMDGSLITGYIPDRSVVFMPQAQIGDVAGVPNDQQLAIYRDDRPLAVDELGMQGPFVLQKVARHREGRSFPLNLEWTAGIDQTNPGLPPKQESYGPSPFPNPEWEAGIAPVEVLPNPNTVFFTANPNVGWSGY